ncbi:MAG TPA: hypothetical protein VK904_06765 [Miltoncostaeaceae bacterium]|nr:hypothetical protein [Miltoncostaeaceae bacterium]
MASSRSAWESKASSTMNSATVNPIPLSAAPPSRSVRVAPRRQAPEAEPRGERRDRPHGQRLAGHQAGDDADRDRDGGGVRERVGMKTTPALARAKTGTTT